MWKYKKIKGENKKIMANKNVQLKDANSNVLYPQTIISQVDGLQSALNGKSVVSGTNDGTNWANITINGTTKAIPAGGIGIHLYRHLLTINDNDEEIDFNMEYYVNDATPITNLGSISDYYNPPNLYFYISHPYGLYDGDLYVMFIDTYNDRIIRIDFSGELVLMENLTFVSDSVSQVF